MAGHECLSTPSFRAWTGVRQRLRGLVAPLLRGSRQMLVRLMLVPGFVVSSTRRHRLNNPCGRVDLATPGQPHFVRSHFQLLDWLCGDHQFEVIRRRS